MSVGEIVVWLVVGGLAGSITGSLVTRKREGLGRWTNLVVGLVGALIGGYLFKILNVDLGLGELKVTLEDVVAAISGSLLFLVAWWLILGKKKDG